MRIGLFGGTFNPIHYGHLRGAEEVRESFSLDKVIFIPAGIPPLKGLDVVNGLHRLNMVKLAVRDNPYFEVSDYEISKKSPSYTLNTVEHFKKLYSKHTLFFIIGIDSFLELHLWHKPEELVKMIDFIVMSRPGFGDIKLSQFIECEQENYFKLKNSDKKVYYISISPYWISSSCLRQMIRNGKSIRYLVPDQVKDYIERKKLYREI